MLSKLRKRKGILILFVKIRKINALLLDDKYINQTTTTYDVGGRQ
jgi:hypothetical protein